MKSFSLFPSMPSLVGVKYTHVHERRHHRHHLSHLIPKVHGQDLLIFEPSNISHVRLIDSLMNHSHTPQLQNIDILMPLLHSLWRDLQRVLMTINILPLPLGMRFRRSKQSHEIRMPNRAPKSIRFGQQVMSDRL